MATVVITGGSRGIGAVFDSLNVERGRGYACKTLTEDGRDSCGNDRGVILKASADALDIDLDDRFAE